LANDDVIEALLRDGLSDWLTLDDVVWAATQGDLTPESKERVRSVLEALYSGDLAVPGDLGSTGFEDWSGDDVEWLARSLVELEKLQWRPMGAGFWIRLTDRRPHQRSDNSRLATR